VRSKELEIVTLAATMDWMERWTSRKNECRKRKPALKEEKMEEEDCQALAMAM